MKNIVLFISMLLLNILVCHAQKVNNRTWNFDDLKDWVYTHQDENPNQQCEIENGILKIYTRPQSWDRKKVRTLTNTYSSGRYIWKTYIPKMGESDQASVGSWIYHDDHHELDFEVGYGNSAIRNKLNASPGDMIVYMTSQALPYSTLATKIKPGWHLFEMRLSLKHNKYHVKWMIDGILEHEVQLQYGNDVAFYIYCSVENLKFLGDHIPYTENYGLFDFVKYKYYK